MCHKYTINVTLLSNVWVTNVSNNNYRFYRNIKQDLFYKIFFFIVKEILVWLKTFKMQVWGINKIFTYFTYTVALFNFNVIF